MTDTDFLLEVGLAEQVLDIVANAAKSVDSDIEVHFEELTAEPGPLPRIMLSCSSSAQQNSTRYISGEVISPFSCDMTLRIAAYDEQDRLDAEAALRKLTSLILPASEVLDGYVAYRKPTASMPRCLGRTSSFEDWRVTFVFNYKKSK